MKVSILCRQLATAVIIASVATPAAFAYEFRGFAQPFACGGGSARVVTNPFNNQQLNLVGNDSVTLTNDVNGSSGVVVYDIGHNILKTPGVYCFYFNYQGDTTKLQTALLVRMCFQPDQNSPDLVTLEIPLSRFKVRHHDDFVEAYIPVDRLWQRPGEPNLRKFSFVLTGPGTVNIGRTEWITGRGLLDERRPAKLLFDNTTCDIAEPCSDLKQ
ncbi:MAG TPA: hypothetical protein V6C81_26670 [Planktothrix sp.]|jgi:hypothetical protein